MGPRKLRLRLWIQLVLAFHRVGDSAFVCVCVFIPGLRLSGSGSRGRLFSWSRHMRKRASKPSHQSAFLQANFPWLGQITWWNPKSTGRKMYSLASGTPYVGIQGTVKNWGHYCHLPHSPSLSCTEKCNGFHLFLPPTFFKTEEKGINHPFYILPGENSFVWPFLVICWKMPFIILPSFTISFTGKYTLHVFDWAFHSLIWYTKGQLNVFCGSISNHQLLSVNSLCLASEGSPLPKRPSCSAHGEVRGVNSWKWGLWNHWTFSSNGWTHVIDWGLFHVAFCAFSHIPSTSPFVDATFNTGQSVLCFSNLSHFLNFFPDNLLGFRVMTLNSWIEHFSK